MSQEIHAFYNLEALLLKEGKEEYYLELLELQVKQVNVKLYLCKTISYGFSKFPSCQEKALNRIWDLCEDDEFMVRKNGISSLKVLAFRFPARIADVLWQFMQSQLEEELKVVKESLLFVLKEFTTDTVDAFFHQMSTNELIRDKALQFLLDNYPRQDSDSSKICEKFIKSMQVVHYDSEQVFTIYRFLSQRFSPSVGVMEKMVSNLLQIELESNYAKDIVKRANACLGFFKQGVSSTPFLEFLKDLWIKEDLKDLKDAQIKHLHLMMLFADLISFQKLEGEYVSLFPQFLMNYFPNGLPEEASLVFSIAEPIVYCIYYSVCSCPGRYGENEGLLGVLRKVFASSQVCRDAIYRKLQSLENLDIKSLQIIKDIKQLKKQHRTAQNIFNMTREMLKPVTARRKLLVTPSWKPEPVERTRAPSDTTLVSGSSAIKRSADKADIRADSSTKKNKSDASRKNPKLTKNGKALKKKQPIGNQPQIPDKNLVSKPQHMKKAEPIKTLIKRAKPQFSSSLTIAGSASRMNLNSSQTHSHRHVSLLRPSALSAGTTMFQRATSAVTLISPKQSSGRIVTFGLRQN